MPGLSCVAGRRSRRFAVCGRSRGGNHRKWRWRHVSGVVPGPPRCRDSSAAGQHRQFGRGRGKSAQARPSALGVNLSRRGPFSWTRVSRPPMRSRMCFSGSLRSWRLPCSSRLDPCCGPLCSPQPEDSSLAALSDRSSFDICRRTWCAEWQQRSGSSSPSISGSDRRKSHAWSRAGWCDPLTHIPKSTTTYELRALRSE
jgi:hypothetical protein